MRGLCVQFHFLREECGGRATPTRSFNSAEWVRRTQFGAPKYRALVECAFCDLRTMTDTAVQVMATAKKDDEAAKRMEVDLE